MPDNRQNRTENPMSKLADDYGRTATLRTVDASPRAERLLQLADALKLSDQQRTFCEMLLVDPDRVATTAALAAGCPKASAHVQGSRWLKLDKIRAYIVGIERETGLAQTKAEAVESRVMSAQEVLERLSDHARVDVGDFISIVHASDILPAETLPGAQSNAVKRLSGFVIDIEKALNAGKGHLVKEISHDAETGAPKLKLVDSQSALDKLAKYHRLYGDEKPVDNSVTVLQVLQVIQAQRPEAKALPLAIGRALLRGAR